MNNRYAEALQDRVAAWRLLLSVILITLAGCTIRLAPDFDRSLMDGLTAATVQIMELCASLSAGTKPTTFAERESTYNQIIGRLDALRIASSARPMPRSQRLLLSKQGAISETSTNGTEMPEAPSVGALEQLVKTLTKMRDTDKKQGLTALEVTAFKQQMEISLDQALTYEKALQREE